jgi:cell pole-organizing protein PopZ
MEVRMSSASARAQEPSMEEILASIRRIISDDQDVKPEAKAAEPEPARPGRLARGGDPSKAAGSGASPAAASGPGSSSGPARETRSAPAQSAPEPVVEAAFARPSAEPAAEPAPVAPAPVEAPAPSVQAEPAPARAEIPTYAAAPSEPAAAERPPASAAPAPPAGFDLSHLDVAVPDITFSDPPERAAPPSATAGRPRPSVETLISQEATASVGDAFNFLSHTILSANARTLEDLVRDLLKPMLKTWLDDNLPSLVERLVRAEIERVARGR